MLNKFWDKINIVTGAAWTWKTYYMKNLYKRNDVFLAVTEKRQKTLNDELWINFRNIYRYFNIKKDYSINLPYKLKIKNLFLDDIWNFPELLFIKIFNYIDFNYLETVYISWDPLQISQLDLSMFKLIKMEKQWRIKENRIVNIKYNVYNINENNIDLFLENFYNSNFTNIVLL